MSCCAPGAEAAAELGGAPSRDEILLASRDLKDGLRQTDLSVPGIHCGACIAAIEGAFRDVPAVEQARVNLSAKRLSVKWRGDTPPPIIETVSRAGYEAHLFDTEEDAADPELSRLVRATAVAGFASMNIMLLSVSVWSGAEPETRQAFHWISAALAFPALLYSGRVFFASAWSALRQGRTNMDVPISVGVILAFALSLYDTMAGGAYAYFDAAVSLLFFLLIGRTLDHMMREKARSAVRGLIKLTPRGATVEREDGSRDYLPANQIETGMLLAVAPGERLLVDGIVQWGRSDIDCALVSGESAAQSVEPGSAVRAGTLNLTGAMKVTATSDASNSSLADMVALMAVADGGRARYRRIADRAARLYSPVVHATAFLTFLGWMVATGDWHRAIGIAIAVLIITCPCALGLAVPIVQTVAARRLFEAGIMVKDGSALERLAEIDMVAFDKTGTLTTGRPRLANASEIDAGALALAGAIAAHSNHPVSRALAAFDDGSQPSPAIITEHPGLGVEARIDRLFVSAGASGMGRTRRLGRDRAFPRWPKARVVRVRRQPAAGRGKLRRSLEARWLSRCDPVRRRRARGFARGQAARRGRRDGAAASRGEGCPDRRTRCWRTQGADGRRRSQRCAGVERRACLHGAIHRQRYRPQRSRLCVSSPKPAVRSQCDLRRQGGQPPRSSELRHRHRL